MAKALVSYSFSKREIKATKPKRPSIQPDPLVSRKLVRCIDNFPLHKDIYGNYFLLKPSKDSTSTLVRHEVPFEVGYTLELIRDENLTPDQLIAPL